MYHIRLQIVQQTLVVRDDHGRGLRRAQLVEALGHNTQRIHIKARICLVEDGKGRLQHGHLEDFVALLFTAAETLVHRTVGQFAVQLDDGTLLAHQLQELACRKGRQMAVLALLVDGSTHKVHHRYTGNLDRRLEGKEDTLVGTVFGRKGQQVLSVESNGATCHFVSRMAYKNVAQRTLSGTVLPHKGVYLTVADGKVDAFQYLFAIDAGMKVFYL